jgi:hypothetical protein
VWNIGNIDAPPDGNGFRYPIGQVYEVREANDNGSFAPTHFSLLNAEKANSIHNVASRGTTSADTLYVAYYTKGVRVLNITNPTNMSEIAYYDTPGLSLYWVPVYNGPWGVDPFLPSANILASSSDGLYVFRKTGDFAGTISVNTMWAGPIKVIGNVTIPAGVTVTTSGATVTLNPGTTLTVEGRLSIDSGTTITGGGTVVKQGSGAIFVTNSATALASNNSRKLARDSNDNYHLVFETNGEVCYEK